jgi:hypothetical protein
LSIIEIKIEKMEEKLNKKIEKAKNANTSWNKCKVISDLYLFLKKDKKFKEVISELERRIKEKNNDFAIVEKRAMNDLGRVRREILEIIEENNLDRNKHKGKAERFLEWDPFHMLKEDQFNKEPREIVGRIISLMAALSKKKRLLFSKFEDNNSQRNKYFSLRYPESYIAYIEEKTKRENETKYHNSEIFWPIWRRIKFIDRLVRSNQEPYDNMRDL